VWRPQILPFAVIEQHNSVTVRLVILFEQAMVVFCKLRGFVSFIDQVDNTGIVHNVMCCWHYGPFEGCVLSTVGITVYYG